MHSCAHKKHSAVDQDSPFAVLKVPCSYLCAYNIGTEEGKPVPSTQG